ncbi:hypothetical protein [Enterococcus gallinarum]|uniref:hypothetical protein n=1 Tax=Enterococcus gallinarum TaxID=1353 RepID=UPI0009BFBC89|nr:hypothetical protein [Enterococcus gallinarum]MDT2682197.1 hypothetical protein [Enterococcus gallinarum]OQO77826.1 hypothetical protein BH745_11805 [Enterococcus gallinarum]
MKKISDKEIWVDKKGLIDRFEGLKKSTLNVWLMEMRDSPEFHENVLNPSQRLVWINLEGFIKFLKWKAHKRGF